MPLLAPIGGDGAPPNAARLRLYLLGAVPACPAVEQHAGTAPEEGVAANA